MFVSDEPWELRFAVKFYPPEPAQLQEELTRYQLVLAVRRDLLEGNRTLKDIADF
jgi:band 4.1-like protein 1/2/3